MWGFLLILAAVAPKIFITVEGTTAFNCRNSLISDEWRQFVLDEVNNYRRSLAMGKVYDKLKNFLPGAKNMNKLNWDCNLEEIAYQAMGGKCATLDLLTFPYVPLQVQLDTNKCRNVTSQMKLNLFGWWTEVEHYDMKNKTKYDDERIRDFAQMAYGAATGFGCTYDACKPKTKFVCLFSTNIYINMDIYDPTWTESEICNACAANCTDRLCPQTPYTPVTINATCKDDKLTQDSNNAALWMHNYYRKLLASGWAKDPKSKSGYAPPGKQMKALEYDCSNATGTSVAEQTYKAIENCQQTGTPNATPGYSMNFLRINDHKISEQDALKQAIKTWWGELEKKGLGSDTTFHDNSGITSFANMANDQVDKVACAVRNCQRTGQTLVMCQYNSPIQEGDKIYETGKICSGCKKLNKKCSNPQGLCVTP